MNRKIYLSLLLLSLTSSVFSYTPLIGALWFSNLPIPFVPLASKVTIDGQLTDEAWRYAKHFHNYSVHKKTIEFDVCLMHDNLSMYIGVKVYSSDFWSKGYLGDFLEVEINDRNDGHYGGDSGNDLKRILVTATGAGIYEDQCLPHDEVPDATVDGEGSFTFSGLRQDGELGDYHFELKMPVNGSYPEDARLNMGIPFGMMISFCDYDPDENVGYGYWLLQGSYVLRVPKTWTVDDDGPGDFHKIQEAINAASLGDTIYVYNGTYNEQVVVDKTLSLVGEDKSATIISAHGLKGEHDYWGVVNLITDNIYIQRFTVTGGWYGALGGISVCGSSLNIICDNIVLENFGGLVLRYSQGNFIDNNLIVDNDIYGLEIRRGSGHNVLRRNSMVGNEINIGVYGSCVEDYIQNIDSSNSVNGKPVYYLVNQEHVEVPSDAGYVAVVNSTNVNVKNIHTQGLLLAYSSNVTISNITSTNSFRGIYLTNSHDNIIQQCNLSFDYEGIRLESSNHNLIAGNNITNNCEGVTIASDYNLIVGNNIANNYEGVVIFDSKNNIICGNTITHHSQSGLNLWGGSTNNFFYHNNFIHNTMQVGNPGIYTVWDDGYPSGGNYWDDYAGVDADDDGIGDTSYTIDVNNQDRYPLSGPFTQFNVPWEGIIYHVSTVSNSSVADFHFSQPSKLISLNINGSVGTIGFCRFVIQKRLLTVNDPTEWMVFVGDQPTTYTTMEDEDNTYICLTYPHSLHNIKIIGTVVIPPQPPVASFTWTPPIPKVNETVTFDASASEPDGGTIVEYKWDFGDGERATGQIATHAYTNLRTYTVTLNITDSEGLSNVEQKHIHVVSPTQPRIYRLLAMEQMFDSCRMKSAQYLIKELLQYPNWNNSTDECVSYIHLLSLYSRDEVDDDVRPFWRGSPYSARTEIVNFLGSASPGEIVILYYCGHSTLKIIPGEGLYSTFLGISKEMLREMLNSTLSQAYVTLILDTCYSGLWTEFSPKSTVLAACGLGTAWGWCYDWSWFTYIGIIEGFSLAEDINSDGWISAAEVFAYAKPATEAYSESIAEMYAQRPSSDYGWVEGDIPLIQRDVTKPFPTWDVAVTSMSVDSLRVEPETNLIINVTVENQGVKPITSDIILYVNSSLMATQQIALLPGENATLTFTWYAVEVYGTCLLNITATVSVCPGEAELADNVYHLHHTLKVALKADVNCDGSVGISDIVTAAEAFGSNLGHPRWNSDADINGDNYVGIDDIVLVARDFGKTYP